ncbi:CRISPR-associated protein DevS [Neosynechococcus sphagnicola sy1]|uniref:CRISPR-associated protein DevS n=1 Tax=Neosynechococcus sphagnicola sy1 TaxID=1497020 RepID=A0A098TK05_9CYAN|nr:type I-MYXAN CRISPR-associated protein Cas5/Cmx5/DevS [Neosynechococcus sphagnicola]KGF72639.1 CRISPR-associated protein DevS [Neosynechococcus sphagnicola sy1]
MIALHVEVPYASFRKSYARSLAETYPFPPPATVYGMLLSLVGEYFRARHAGVQLAFAYACQPKIATTLRKLSRYKYGVASKQSKLGNAPDFIETLCGIEFLCWIDSSKEEGNISLESRVIEAIDTPERIERTGVVSLGLSDDAVNDISLIGDLLKLNQQYKQHNEDFSGWHWLIPQENGQIELPVWVDHVGSLHTRWQRYQFDHSPSMIDGEPEASKFTLIADPR